MQSNAVYLALWDWETENASHTAVEENGKTREYKNYGLSYWLDYAREPGKSQPGNCRADQDLEEMGNRTAAILGRPIPDTSNPFRISASGAGRRRLGRKWMQRDCSFRSVKPSNKSNIAKRQRSRSLGSICATGSGKNNKQEKSDSRWPITGRKPGTSKTQWAFWKTGWPRPGVVFYRKGLFKKRDHSGPGMGH